MAGMTEYRISGRDSFWTWRELMYRFLDQLEPEHFAAIASQTFMEMQLSGYASVGEFHYVHHQKGGKPYADIAELSLRIMEAANVTGIGLTHLSGSLYLRWRRRAAFGWWANAFWQQCRTVCRSSDGLAR